MWPNPQETADLVTFTEEILNGNFIFCALFSQKDPSYMFDRVLNSSKITLQKI